MNQQECAACGSPSSGDHSIHRNGFGRGPEVPLCDACGSGEAPSCGVLWATIALRRAHKRRRGAKLPTCRQYAQRLRRQGLTPGQIRSCIEFALSLRHPVLREALPRSIKVGMVVAWSDVPDGAMVRDGDGWHAIRLRGRGIYVGQPGEDWLSANPWSDAGRWHWNHNNGGEVTVVALGLTGRETAADLQRLAEVSEVREALEAMLTCPYCDNEEPTFETFEDGSVSQPWCTECDSEMGDPHLASEAERLYDLGWRKGMTAADAARRLESDGGTGVAT